MLSKLMKLIGLAALPPTMITEEVGTPQPKYSHYTQNGEAHENDILIYSCFEFLCNNLQEAPIYAYNRSNDKPLYDHPITNLLQRPNPHMDFSRYVQAYIKALYFYGSFWSVILKSGARYELYPLETPNVTPYVDNNDNLIYIEYKQNNTKQQGIKIDPDLLVFTAKPSGVGKSQWTGVAPLTAASRAWKTHIEMMDFINVVYVNRGLNPFTIVQTEEHISEEQREKFLQAWTSNYSGRRRGLPMFTSSGVNIQTLGINNKDLENDSLNDILEVGICQAFGVSPILVGSMAGLRRSTYSNYETALLAFIEQTLLPLQSQFDAAHEHALNRFDGNIYLQFDNTELSGLAPRRKQEAESATQLYSSGIITLNEARGRVGFSELANGDEVKPQGGGLFGLKDKSKIVKLNSSMDQVNAMLERRRTAEGYLSEYTDTARKIMRAHSKAFKRLVSEVTGNSLSAIDKCVNLQDPQRDWALILGAKVMDIWNELNGEGNRNLFGETMTKVYGRVTKIAGQNLGIDDLIDPYAKQFINDYGFKFIQKVSDTSVNDFRKLLLRAQAGELTIEEFTLELGNLSQSWTGSRAEAIARSEIIRTANHATSNAWYASNQVEAREWFTAPDDYCPHCATMQGKIVGFGEPFARVGDQVEGTGDDLPDDYPPLTITYETVEVPPLHTFCRCGLLPVLKRF